MADLLGGRRRRGCASCCVRAGPYPKGAAIQPRPDGHPTGVRACVRAASEPGHSAGHAGIRPRRRYACKSEHGSQGPLARLGSFIREQRGTARLSLRRLSELAGISNPYLSQIERGLRRPSAEILQQIAKALRISAETLYVQAGILEAPAGHARPDPGHHGRPDHQRGAEAGAGAHLPLLPARVRGRARTAARPRPRRTGARAPPAPGDPCRRSPTRRPTRPVPPGRVATGLSRRTSAGSLPGALSRPPVGSERHAPARRPLSPHVAPGPARHGRRRRHERLRPRADRRAGPLRRGLRRLHPGLVARSAARGRGRAGPAGAPRARRAARAPCPRRRCPAVVDEFTAGRARAHGRGAGSAPTAAGCPTPRCTPTTGSRGCRAT